MKAWVISFGHRRTADKWSAAHWPGTAARHAQKSSMENTRIMMALEPTRRISGQLPMQVPYTP